MSLKVRILGSRGSLPAPTPPEQERKRGQHLLTRFLSQGNSHISDIPNFLAKLSRYEWGGYGGNTPCIEVISEKSKMIIDAGSGIRSLGSELMTGECGKGRGDVHLFFTHFHWDHLIGLPFFTPIFVPGNQIHVYAVQPKLEEVFKTLFQKPFFPVPLSKLGSEIHYHQLKPRVAHEHHDMKITPYQLDHPDPCWGFKIESAGRTYAHCVDTEAKRVSQKELGPDLALYQGIDLMVFDAQYTLGETVEKIEWGHAAASIGIDLALREKIKKVIFMHHDPASSDEKIAKAEFEAKKYHESQIKVARRNGEIPHEFEWSFAYDGLVVEV
jgi:phosphoribosyl 1,2-cyclic phosphodiesterase